MDDLRMRHILLEEVGDRSTYNRRRNRKRNGGPIAGDEIEGEDYSSSSNYYNYYGDEYYQLYLKYDCSFDFP